MIVHGLQTQRRARLGDQETVRPPDGFRASNATSAVAGGLSGLFGVKVDWVEREPATERG